MFTWSSVDEAPMPQFQHQEVPKLAVEVLYTSDMLIEQSSHHVRPEVASPEAPRIKEDIVRHLLQVVPEPMVNGDDEPLFGPIQDLHREEIGHRSLQKIFFFPAPDLERRRQGGGKLHQRMIEKGRSNL